MPASSSSRRKKEGKRKARCHPVDLLSWDEPIREELFQGFQKHFPTLSESYLAAQINGDSPPLF